MTKSEIKAKLRAVIASEINPKIPALLDDKSRLYEDLGLNSFMVIQIIVYVEDELNVTFQDEVLYMFTNELSTVGELVAYVDKFLGDEAM